MSFLGTILKGAIGGFASGGTAGAVTGALGGLVGGGGGDINIARSLSKELGCTIAQSNASQARALQAKGIDPCTGESMRAGGINPDGTFQLPPGVVLDPGFNMGGALPGSQPIPVFGPGAAMPLPVTTRSGGGGLEFTRTGLIRNVIVNGRRISRRNAAAFIRKAGMEVGARGLGLSLQQAAMVVLQQSNRPRRRRGISGAQITQAKRVINTINSMAKSLGSCAPRRRAATRKPTCR